MKAPLLIVCAMLFSGCSTLKSNHFADVKVSCDPENSIASVNGESKASPATFKAVTNKDIDVSCQKPGYITSSRKVRTHITTSGVFDAIGGFLFLFPAVGLLSPGAWELDETTFEMTLVEQPE